MVISSNVSGVKPVITYGPLTKIEKSIVVALAILTLPLFGVLGIAAYYHFRNKHKITQEIQNPAAQSTADKANTAAQSIKPADKNDEAAMNNLAKVEEFFGSLKGVVADLKQGMPEDIAILVKKHGIDKIIEQVSSDKLRDDLKKTLYLKINAYLVRRELDNKTKAIASVAIELELLKQLGVDVPKESAYHDKDVLYDFIQTMVNSEINKDIDKLEVDQIKQWFKRKALAARLATVGITDENKVKKFEVLLAQYKCVMENQAYEKFAEPKYKVLVTQASSLKLTDETFPAEKFPMASKLFEMQTKDFQEACLESAFRHYVKNTYKGLFEDANASIDFDPAAPSQDFLKKVYRGYTTNINSRIDKRKKAAAVTIDFYKTYSDNILKEFIQGFDDQNKVFGRGVCYSLVAELQRRSEADPQSEDPLALGLDDITPSNRYNQARGHVGLKIDGSFLPAQGFEPDEKLFSIEKFEKSQLKGLLTAEFAKIPQAKMQPAGWVPIILDFGGSSHAVSIRLDANNQKFWMFDPNAGLFHFNDADKCIQALSDLINAFYEQTISVSGDYRKRK